MTREEFEKLVHRLEVYARAHPALYKVRVAALAALGYGYILLVLSLSLGALLLLVSKGYINFLTIKIGWILVLLVAAIIRAMWVRLPPPEGVELSREEFPPVFEMVDELTRALDSPRFHKILLTNDFNAAVVQIPRLGLLGWQQNYLLLGLPLMQALTVSQFRAVVAHELGHLSGNHGRFGSWIYRVRMTWGQLSARLQQEHRHGALVFDKFLQWYAPFFNAYTFVLARAHEYEADRCTAILTGAENAAETLIEVEVKGRFIEHRFWPDMFKRANAEAEPPPAFAHLYHALHETSARRTAAEQLSAALMAKTDLEDTHPCLSERLAALDYPLALDRLQQKNEEIVPLTEFAAQSLFGDAATASFTDKFDQAWRAQIKGQWRERFEYAQKSLKELEALREKGRETTPSIEELWQEAYLAAEFLGEEAAKPLLEKILALDPQHVAANFLFGEMLLGQDDARGIDHLETTMLQEADGVLPGCERIILFLERNGRAEEACVYRKRGEEFYNQLAQAEQERKSVSATDEFLPHGMTPEDAAKLREQFSVEENIESVMIARKAVSNFPERPFYVVAIVPRTKWYRNRSAKDDRRLAEVLAAGLQMPGQFIVYVLNTKTRGLRKRLEMIEAAKFYSAGEH